MSDTFQLPSRGDPRLPVACILFSYLVLGVTVLGFNRTPTQILVVIAVACAADIVLHRLVRGQWLFPMSALITGMSLSILVNYAHGSFLAIIPACLAIASKYIITFNGRHVYNPALFGIVVGLLVGGDMISISPAYQWGGYPAMAMFVITAAILTFGLKINRLVLIVSFLGFYSLALCIRAWLTRHHVPPETLFMGAMTSPAFYLFTFFMITDPATSPESHRGQFFAAFCIVCIDFYLHTRESLSTFFYAAFILFTLRWIFLHAKALVGRQASVKVLASRGVPRILGGAVVALGIFLFVQFIAPKRLNELPGFTLQKVSLDQTGLQADDGGVLEKVDERIQNVAKWVLSVGDAVAIADYDQDGLQDIFLTYPLKMPSQRAALFRNTGDFKFARMPIPALEQRVSNEKTGLPSSALWFDHDNDGDSDLFIGMGYGRNILLRNNLAETGRADFSDISGSAGIDDYSISVTANAFDANKDGYSDLLVGNSMGTTLPDYNPPMEFNVFNLPQPAYDNDRRMFNFMHRTWHDASNGGVNRFYQNRGGTFESVAPDISGLSGQRWTIDIGTGDLDNDGDTDLYLANDFGPDELFVNDSGRFTRIAGRFSGEIGRDTYKGMNASLADFDNNGTTDIYVSNVHEPLQAEGSLLWMNNGNLKSDGYQAFKDSASGRNILNEHRFGWGAAVADLDLDGRLDVLQANGMVGDDYDDIYPGCPDYWYWNEQIALTGPDTHGYADKWADLRGRCIFPDEPDRAMLNQGRYFVDVAEAIGLHHGASSRGIATADFDNDGDLDFIITHQFAAASTYENVRNHDNNWIGLRLIGDGVTCNTDALGSKVVVTTTSGAKETIQQMREVVASNGFSAQNDSRLVFGLGASIGTVDITVTWCGEDSEDFTLAPNKYHDLRQALVSTDIATGLNY